MREKRNLIISTVLGAILGWILGFLRLPFLEKNFSFLLGFIACLSIVLLGSLIMYIWRKKTLSPPSLQKNTFRSISILSLILVGGFTSSFLFFQQNKFSKIHANQQNKQLAEQLELEATARKSNALILINNLVSQIEEELTTHPQRMLSDEMIERIATLNYSFKPYSYFDGEKFSEKKWSPERGQLLLSLAKMKIDSSSFRQIKMKTSFFGADLKNADLSGADLNGIDLRNANLKNAQLQETIFKNADLRGINLWGTNLKNANLSGTDLKRANIQWADLDYANLSEADLDDANLTSSKLRHAKLNKSKLRWGEMVGAFLNEANLEEMDLLGTNLERANLEKTNLSKTSLRGANLYQANLKNANLNEIIDLSKATIENEDWLKNLAQWQVIGAKKIQEKYTIVKKESIYQLKPIDL